MNSGGLQAALQQARLSPLSPVALTRFEQYLGLLLKWNSRMNLTAIREPDAIIRRHLLEGIQCAQALPQTVASTLLDYGSGAGFPGIPIAICRPEIQVTLAESQRKKAAFLREVARSLGLTTEVFDGRVEKMTPERTFSFVTLRAVDKMDEAIAAALGRVNIGGWLIVSTTREAEASLQLELSGVNWRIKLPIVGTAQGELLMGQKGQS